MNVQSSIDANMPQEDEVGKGEEVTSLTDSAAVSHIGAAVATDNYLSLTSISYRADLINDMLLALSFPNHFFIPMAFHAAATAAAAAGACGWLDAIAVLLVATDPAAAVAVSRKVVSDVGNTEFTTIPINELAELLVLVKRFGFSRIARRSRSP